MVERNLKTEKNFDGEEVEQAFKATDPLKYEVEGSPNNIVYSLPGAPPN